MSQKGIEKVCKCTLRETSVGDGCRYCNPQYLIDILIGQQDDCENEVKLLRRSLVEISKIKDRYDCGDWDEIEDARKIAIRALKATE